MHLSKNISFTNCRANPFQKLIQMDAPKWKFLLEKRIKNASEIDLKRISFEIEFYLKSVEDARLREILAEIGTDLEPSSNLVEDASPVQDLIPSLSDEERQRLEFRCKFLQMSNLLDKPVSSPAVIKNLPKAVVFTHKQLEDDGVDDKLQQEKLTEFLGAQTSKLLENSKTLHSELLKDSAALTELENEMTDRDIKLGAERSRIQQISASGWSTTLLIWGSILVAVLAFMSAFLYMRMFGVIKFAPQARPEILKQQPMNFEKELVDTELLEVTGTHDDNTHTKSPSQTILHIAEGEL
jgi:hypothetical protein